MEYVFVSLALAGVLSIADYITEQFFSKRLRENKKLISFSAGVAVAYIVLNLFPEISSYALIEGKKAFLYVLAGFVALNLIEQYIYKNIKNPSASHKSVHIGYFFIYKILIGVVLVYFASRGLAKTLLFFIPFLLYVIVELIPQEFGIKNNLFKVFYSMAPLFGAFFGVYFLEFIDSVFGKLVAFITGTLLYIVIRESLPSNEYEKPLYFIIGVLFYSIVIYLFS